MVSDVVDAESLNIKLMEVANELEEVNQRSNFEGTHYSINFVVW